MIACVIAFACQDGSIRMESDLVSTNPSLRIDGGASAPMGMFASSCLENTICADDFDCTGGTRCNLAINPPRCQKIYCGLANTWCSEDAFCQTGYGCHESICRPCVDCNGECVFVESDPDHCGQCNNRVEPGQSCVDGVRLCADTSKRDCGDGCLEVSSIKDHCGACGVECADGAACIAGQCEEFVTINTLQGGVPMSCDELCLQKSQKACKTLDEFPVYRFLPGATERSFQGCGVAVYKKEGANETTQVYSELNDCDSPATEFYSVYAFTEMVCACY